MTSFAKVVSFVLHPLWMPLFTLLILYSIDPFLGLSQGQFKFLGVLLLICILAPGISILVMVKRKIVSDIEVSNKSERYVPFFLVLFYYILTYGFLRWNHLHLPKAIYALLFSLIVSLIIAMLVNLQTKVSIHLMAMGGVAGALLAFNQMHLLGIGFFMGFWLLLSALLAWSRIYQGLHTTKQVYLGFSLGFLIHFGVISYQYFL